MADIHNRLREAGAYNRKRREMGRALSSFPSPAAAPHGLALAIGTRVLDLITGLEGVIVDGAANHIILNGAGKPAG